MTRIVCNGIVAH